MNRHVLLFFMDGVGLGAHDPEVNPFLSARLPHLTGHLGSGWFLRQTPLVTERASLIPTDAGLGVPGRPQSATGQAAILTGRNVPRLIGRHYGPKPNEAVAEQLRQDTLFHDVVAAGGEAALLTPYPHGYFEAIASGRRLYSAVPLAASNAGVRLRTADDLRQGRAVSPMFTGQAWRDHLGYDDIPLLTLPEAGRRIATLAAAHTFTFFEHWPSDRAGHRGTLHAAAEHLEILDTVLGALIEAWDDEHGLLVITSDHGNIEAKDRRQHTENPVPTLLIGQQHAAYAPQIRDLTDIAATVRDFLTL